MLPHSDIFDLLEQAHDRFNRQDFIADDPISIPHLFSRKEDIEIAGFLVALIAWGKRNMILKNAQDWMARMDHSPYEFVCGASESEISRLSSFVHRTFNGVDTIGLTFALREVYQNFHGLENIFTTTAHENKAYHAIIQARNILIQSPFPTRSQKHIANPAGGASAKRLNMFLRWMVRKDKRGVDFGLWKCLQPQDLICPLDVHTGNVGRKLSLLSRLQNDWKSALELTESLRLFSPEDPVKYDFALFGLGVSGEM